MSFSAELIPFEPSKLGVLFIGKPGGIRRTRKDCHITIEGIINGYGAFLKDEMPDLYSQMKAKIDTFKAKKPVIDAEASWYGFHGVKCKVKGYSPYLYDGSLEFANLADALNIFWEWWDKRYKLKMHPPELVNRAIPYFTCCWSTEELITGQMDFLFEKTKSILSLEEYAPGASGVPCALEMEIVANSEIEASIQRIEEAFREKLIESTGGMFCYSEEFAQKVTWPFRGQTTVLFHITVLSDQAYLGFMIDPDKRNWYEFPRFAGD